MRTNAAAAAVVLGVLLAACSESAPPGPTGSTGATGVSTPGSTAAAEHIYTVRGQIASLPNPANVGSGLQIRHERVPGYVNSKGEAVGMESMTMSFTPAPGLDLSGLAPGDPVEFTWEMRWNPREERFSRVVRIMKLPPGTTLDFGAK